MRRTAERIIPSAPHEVLLVMDATTGQNGLQQARLFTDSAGVTGIVLTKLDGTAKGGIAVAIARELKVPVRYVGVGEKLDDLLPFDSKAFVDSLLGKIKHLFFAKALTGANRSLRSFPPKRKLLVTTVRKFIVLRKML